MQIELPISQEVKQLIRSVYKKKEELAKCLNEEGLEGQEEREDVLQL